MKVAEPTQPAAAAEERVCRCPEPQLRTRVRGKWATDRYCERCGRLGPITLRS